MVTLYIAEVWLLGHLHRTNKECCFSKIVYGLGTSSTFQAQVQPSRNIKFLFEIIIKYILKKNAIKFSNFKENKSKDIKNIY